MSAGSLEGFESGFLPLFYSFSTISDVSSFFDQHTALISALHSGTGVANRSPRLSTNAQLVVAPSMYENALTRYSYLPRIFAENTSTEVFSSLEPASRSAHMAAIIANPSFISVRVAPVPVRQRPAAFSRQYSLCCGRTQSSIAALSIPTLLLPTMVATSNAVIRPALGVLSTDVSFLTPSTSFSYSMQGDHFTPVSVGTLSSGLWASTQEVKLPSLTAAQTYIPFADPATATAYDSVELERPVRLGVTKVYEPSLFAGKTDGVPTNLLRFSNKLLFD